uniref:ABC transporter ATP-binding protein n=1 Tax=Ignisphaera aggregans TaxID=334771 RepID=A0A7J3IAG3_9CREN
MGDALIRLDNVWKVYRMGKVEYPALRGISMNVERSEFLCIVGPSGSGKTTLLNIMGALDRPTKGEIFIENIPLSTLSDDKLAELRNRRIGFVFQTFNLLSHLTVVENVELPMVALGIPTRRRRERAIEVLSRFLPQETFYKRPLELSGGEQQRVAIARALANNPDIILADEPTGNLDSANAHLIAKIFRELRDEGKTIVMITHNIELTDYADRIVKLRDGQIMEIIKR